MNIEEDPSGERRRRARVKDLALKCIRAVVGVSELQLQVELGLTGSERS